MTKTVVYLPSNYVILTNLGMLEHIQCVYRDYQNDTYSPTNGTIEVRKNQTILVPTEVEPNDSTLAEQGK